MTLELAGGRSLRFLLEAVAAEGGSFGAGTREGEGAVHCRWPLEAEAEVLAEAAGAEAEAGAEVLEAEAAGAEAGALPSVL